MKKSTSFNRRAFIKTSVTGTMASSLLMKSPVGSAITSHCEDPVVIKEYRTLGRTGFKVSDIGMGAGNLTNPSVLRAAFDMGINYIDTAEHYGGGQSERAIGDALKGIDRKKIFITSKLNLDYFGGSSKDELKTRFHKILERLQTPYVDCLMIHMAQSAEQLKHTDFHEMALEMRAEGKLKYLGLSNHGPEHRLAGNMKEPMEKVVLAAAEDGRFDVVLFVYNFIQKEQGERIIKACKEKSIGLTLMKVDPISFNTGIKSMLEEARQDGREIPESIHQMKDEYEEWIRLGDAFMEQYNLKTEREIRDAAIRFVLTNPDIHAVCPTISNFESLDTFVRLSGQRLIDTEARMLNEYQESRSQSYCRHACGTCEPACPHHIPINTILRYNHYFEAHGREKHAMQKYAKLQIPSELPCKDCTGFCIPVCPHHIPIQLLLLNAHTNLLMT